MAMPTGTHVERRFVPLSPCPDGAPHFHIPKAISGRYVGWNLVDTFFDPADETAWMLVAKKREG
jgi:hypothetical protein